MKPKRFHLAQANIGRMRAPLDSSIMEGFSSQLDRLNAIADASPGFVWRLQTDEGNATAIRAYEDERILFNMSVWESLEALHHYVYRSDHAGPLRNRKEWFEPLEGPILVLVGSRGSYPVDRRGKGSSRHLEVSGIQRRSVHLPRPVSSTRPAVRISAGHRR